MRELLRWLVLATLVGRGLVTPAAAAEPTNAPATTPNTWVVRAWATAEGLPQNTVNAILQTRDGYLWVGTREGLARFDGVRFTVFGLGAGLQSVEVRVLYEDRRGVLWIGTGGGGLSRLVDGRIETISDPQGLAGSGVITALAEDEEGCIWIGSLGGMSWWRDGQFVRKEAAAELERVGVRSLLRDHEGVIWIDTTAGRLFQFQRNQLISERGPSGNETISAYCLLEDREGNLWASVGNGTVLCRRGGQWGKYDQTDGLPFAYVTSFAELPDGSIWAGSLDDGLYHFRGGRFLAMRKEDGLSANDIRSLFTDREGNLWVGTRTGGLNRLSRGNLTHCGSAQGLTNEFTRSVAEAADGTLWVATIGGGIYHGDMDNLSRFAPEPVMSFYASVETILAAKDGSLWWGGARSLLRWNEGRLAGCYTNESWVKSAAVTALCEGAPGELWIGTSEGQLVRYRGGQFSMFPRRVALGAVTALARHSDGSLWVGSVAGGLRLVRVGREDTFSVINGLLSRSIRTLYLDRAETLWIGTAGGGLGRYRDGQIVNFTALQGLGADTVSQIVEDDFDNLWLGTSRGIFRIPKSALEAVATGKAQFLHPMGFGVNEGMPVEECSSGFSPAGLKMSSGMICFSTVKGLVFVDPRLQESRAPPPRVLLEEILVNSRLQNPVAVDSPPAKLSPELPSNNGLPPQRLIVPPGSRELEVHYTAINLTAPERIQFRYRLDELSQEWSEAGERRAADYHRLPPGDYVFRVAACNADGVWSEEPSSLAITVQPFLWETGWFRLVAALAFVGALAWVLRLAEQRKFKRRLARLQTQQAIDRERLRISQDMHDHVGGMLTQISQLSDLGQGETTGNPPARGRFDRIGGQARAAVQALDEIVWATNPKNDNLPRFAEYVSRFADEFFENSAVRCWQEMPADLPELPLRADLRHNVFLAIREALHNVLKHSGATALWLRMALDNSQVRIEIEDNGRGFDPGQAAADRNGLANMKTRLAECGGQAEFISAPGKGTRVRFAFPLSPAS